MNTTIQCHFTQPQLIAAANLQRSDLNVRRTGRSDGIAEMKASILAHGLMQNLVVTLGDDDMYRVIAGGRRLEAIHLLQAEGSLPSEFAVPCQLVTGEHAVEMSLAENTIRLAMHPADQFQAFAALMDKGAAAAEVAARFGIEEALVHRRMKLARVAPELFEAYRQGEITLECLMAYTMTDDHLRQRKVHESLQGCQKDDPATIRDALTEEMVGAASKLARFVGLDAYLAAGGSTRSDLFGDDVYLEKPALLNKLAEKKFDGIRSELVAEGWNWIEINPERDWILVSRCTRIKPVLMNAPTELMERKASLEQELEVIEQALEDGDSNLLAEQLEALQARLDDVEELLLAFVGLAADEKALSGCFVSLDQDGTPFIEKGLVRPEHQKQLAKCSASDVAGADHSVECRRNLYPGTLQRELADARLRIAQVAVASHPFIAFDLLVFQLAARLLGHHRVIDGPAIAFQPSPVAPNENTSNVVAEERLASVAAPLMLDWLTAEGEVAQFEAFCQLPESEKQYILSHCVALTLKPKLAATLKGDLTAYDVALSLTEADAADYWRPTKDNFLSRLNREQLLAVGSDVLGDGWSAARSRDKKTLLVDQLHRAFASPDAPGRAPEQIERLKTWLPKGMSLTLANPAATSDQDSARTAA